MEYLIESASSFAGRIDNVILLVAVLTGFWLFLVEGVLFYFLFKYRRSNSPKSIYMTGEKKSETKLISWAHYLVLGCDILVVYAAISVWYHVKQELPNPDATIRVIGNQWSWIFVHPGKDGKIDTDDDVKTVDELHVMVDKTYHFKLESNDVMHSFSVPVFRLKQDTIPGRIITGWFKPTKTGEHDIQCAEMCGIGHGIMAARIFIKSEEEHRKWLDGKG